MHKCLNCAWQGESLNGIQCPVCGDNRTAEIVGIEKFEPKRVAVAEKVEVKSEDDLNNDGVVDDKDVSLAAKVLSKSKKKRKF